jgi:hypothetical protein
MAATLNISVQRIQFFGLKSDKKLNIKEITVSTTLIKFKSLAQRLSENVILSENWNFVQKSGIFFENLNIFCIENLNIFL